jgi:hypothetical protein
MTMTARDRVSLGEDNDGLDSLVDFINLYSYDEQDQCYALADGSIGTAFEMQPIACTTASDSDLFDIADSVALALSTLRDGIVGQLILVPSLDIDAELKAYERYGGSTHPVIQGSERRKTEFTLELRTRSAFRKGDLEFRVKKYRLVFLLYARPDEKIGGLSKALKDSLTIFGMYRDESSGDLLTPEEQRYYRMKEKLTTLVNMSRRRLTGSLSKYAQCRQIPPDELMGIYRNLMYPRSCAQVRNRYDPRLPLSQQIPLTSVNVDTPRGIIHSDGAVFRCAILANLPDFSHTGRLSRPVKELNWSSFIDFMPEGYITINFTSLSKGYMRRYLGTRKSFLRGGMAPEAKIPDLMEDVLLAEDYVENDGRRFFDMGITVTVFADDEHTASASIELVREKMAEIGLSSRIEDYCAPSIWFQSLPFGFGPSLREASRTFMVPDQFIADMMPMYFFSRGNSSRKGIPFLLLNRGGEPFNLDFFEGSAPHFIMVGMSGSGKSFFTTNMVADYLRDPPSQVFFIDKGRSYSTFTAMMGEQGSNNNMGLTQKTCINIFAGTYGTSGTFIKSLLGYLASPTAADLITGEQMGKLEEALLATFKNGQFAIEYHSYEELKEAYPDAWVDRCDKFFEVAYLDDLSLTNIMNLKSGEGGRQPDFDLYYSAVLIRKTSYDKTTKKEMVETFTTLQRMTNSTTKFLMSRDFLLRERVVNGEPRIVVYYTKKQQEQSLRVDKFEFMPIEDVMICRCGREDDFVAIADAGVTIQVTEEFFLVKVAEEAEKIRQDPQYAKASDEAVQDLAIELAQQMDPLDYFLTLTGNAVMQREVFFRDLIGYMEMTDDPDLIMFTKRFAPYYGDGAFAGFFDGPTEFRLRGKKVVTFELQELSSAGPHLLSAVVGSLLQMLILYGQEDDIRGHRKMIILDEFWQLLANPMIAEQVVNLYRTARKFNTCCGVITQVITDLLQNDAGRTIAANAPTHLLMKQPKEVCNQLDELLDFRPEEIALMKTVNTEFGFYSECYVRNTQRGISDVARLIPTPYFYWIATTNAEDAAERELRRKRNKAMGMSDTEALAKALSDVSEDMPAGKANGSVKKKEA